MEDDTFRVGWMDGYFADPMKDFLLKHRLSSSSFSEKYLSLLIFKRPKLRCNDYFVTHFEDDFIIYSIRNKLRKFVWDSFASNHLLFCKHVWDEYCDEKFCECCMWCKKLNVCEYFGNSYFCSLFSD